LSLLAPIFWLIGYLSGSLPFALWITRLVKGIDVRDGGSGHVTTTNTIRQAGWVPGVIVLLLDMTKGFLPVFFGLRVGLSTWEVAVTAGLIVAGHCWPVFAQFRGGMGLATMGGALLAVSPLGFLLAFATLLFFVLVLHHGARGSLVTGLVAPLLLWLVGLRSTEFWVAVAAGLVVAVRFTIDWNRKYRELWLDRER
jgi:acyl phosphate:glycerol-3-phosphate acyltransferase